MTERPTPRTDAFLKRNATGFGMGDFARQLERELSEAREKLARRDALLREALDQWWHWMTIPFAQRSVVDAYNAQERIAEIQKELG